MHACAQYMLIISLAASRAAGAAMRAASSTVSTAAAVTVAVTASASVAASAAGGAAGGGGGGMAGVVPALMGAQRFKMVSTLGGPPEGKSSSEPDWTMGRFGLGSIAGPSTGARRRMSGMPGRRLAKKRDDKGADDSEGFEVEELSAIQLLLVSMLVDTALSFAACLGLVLVLHYCALCVYARRLQRYHGWKSRSSAARLIIDDARSSGKLGERTVAQHNCSSSWETNGTWNLEAGRTSSRCAPAPQWMIDERARVQLQGEKTNTQSQDEKINTVCDPHPNARPRLCPCTQLAKALTKALAKAPAPALAFKLILPIHRIVRRLSFVLRLLNLWATHLK